MGHRIAVTDHGRGTDVGPPCRLAGLELGDDDMRPGATPKRGKKHGPFTVRR